jgi:hypothetical protein
VSGQNHCDPKPTATTAAAAATAAAGGRIHSFNEHCVYLQLEVAVHLASELQVSPRHTKKKINQSINQSINVFHLACSIAPHNSLWVATTTSTLLSGGLEGPHTPTLLLPPIMAVNLLGTRLGYWTPIDSQERRGRALTGGGEGWGGRVKRKGPNFSLSID